MPTILETERLVLRPWSPEDAEDLFRIYSDAEVMRFLGNGRPEPGIEETRQRIVRRMAHHERHGFGFNALVEKATGQLIGACGLQHLEDGPHVEVGYHLARPVWNRGYATEAAGACLRYGFRELRLDRIVGVVALENYASQRVLEKIGMRYEGPGFHYHREVKVYVATRPD